MVYSSKRVRLPRASLEPLDERLTIYKQRDGAALASGAPAPHHRGRQGAFREWVLTKAASAVVAQLERATGLGPVGYGFDSRPCDRRLRTDRMRKHPIKARGRRTFRLLSQS